MHIAAVRRLDGGDLTTGADMVLGSADHGPRHGFAHALRHLGDVSFTGDVPGGPARQVAMTISAMGSAVIVPRGCTTG